MSTPSEDQYQNVLDRAAQELGCDRLEVIAITRLNDRRAIPKYGQGCYRYLVGRKNTTRRPMLDPTFPFGAGWSLEEALSELIAKVALVKRQDIEALCTWADGHVIAMDHSLAAGWYAETPAASMNGSTLLATLRMLRTKDEEARKA